MKTNQSADPTLSPPSDPNRAPRKWDFGHIALGTVASVLAVISLWLWYQVSEVKRQAHANLSSTESRSQRLLEEQRQANQSTLVSAQREAARNQALAFAAAIQPVMTFRGQIPEVTDRAVQTATENLARRGSYSFVAVTDANGKVVSSSDLTILGSDFKGNLEPGVAEFEGESQAVAVIGSDDTEIGHVIIRTRG